MKIPLTVRDKGARAPTGGAPTGSRRKRRLSSEAPAATKDARPSVGAGPVPALDYSQTAGTSGGDRPVAPTKIFIRSGEPQDHGNLVVGHSARPHHQDTKTPRIARTIWLRLGSAALLTGKIFAAW